MAKDLRITATVTLPWERFVCINNPAFAAEHATKLIQDEYGTGCIITGLTVIDDFTGEAVFKDGAVQMEHCWWLHPECCNCGKPLYEQPQHTDPNNPDDIYCPDCWEDDWDKQEPEY